MSPASNNAVSSISISTSTHLEEGSTTTSHLYNSGQAQGAWLFPQMSTYAQSAQDHISSRVFPLTTCQGGNSYAPGLLSHAGKLEQGPMGYGQGETVFQSPYSSVEHAVAVFNWTQALSHLLSEAISCANTECPASEALDVVEYDKENWIADAPHDLENSLQLVYASTRKPFEDCGVAPSSLKLVDDSIRLTTYTPETIALSSPPRRSSTTNAVRRERPSPSASHVRPTFSFTQVFGRKAAPPRISEYAQTIPLILSQPSRLLHSPRKRLRSSEVDDSGATPSHKKAKSNTEEVVLPGSSGSYEDAPATTAPQTIHSSEISTSMTDSKRPHTEDGNSSDAPHQAKKAKAPRGQARATAAGQAVTKRSRARKAVAATRAGPPVAGPSNLPGARARRSETDMEEDSEADDAHASHGMEATAGRTKRDRRTKAQVVAVTRTDLPKVSCPIEGCLIMFDPLTHDANRDHLKLHYPVGALDSSESLLCLWTECMMQEGKGKRKWWTKTRKPGNKMITHLHQDHVGRAYTCPVESCTKWASSRSGDLPQHLARNHKGWRPP
ncbi:uncharacterized protein TRAVEDRAFT_50469 [Trametes versicolor FP-101664 SS1]|uniref:uncharacterized protein n=1 Tax=Trametes versicolor (strain FP-101664) TaxID=717944 RepID=UPI0004622E1F|nr:uncharacterized protein TRAVEDRAFT_50469 [Trametes versicolor FP-101664 SS1]EIW55979.1 hypothetical protein TRAVEDRAFT_50469 [Trametes versicolor FP-101664 SS1]